MNDVNVLHRSSILEDFVNGKFPNIAFQVNGNNYNTPYWLAGGIYPSWAVFVKTISDPQGRAKQLFSKLQESYRKDVERAFGVLQQRFHIVRHPSRYWKHEKMSDIMTTCVILHMIVEHERLLHGIFQGQNSQNYMEVNNDNLAEQGNGFVLLQRLPSSEPYPGSLAFLLAKTKSLRSSTTHQQLRNDLVEHVWNSYSCRQI